MLEPTPEDFVWRGMGNADWCPSSSLDRFIRDAGIADKGAAKARLHTEFVSACYHIGRTVAASDNDAFWAFAQHEGLPSPFLDWTSSPWIALYFAASSPTQNPTTQKGLILRLDKKGIPDGAGDLRRYEPPGPFDSRRLPAQLGLFTETVDVCFLEALKRLSRLNLITAYTFPMAIARDLLEQLARMNIRDVTLFPDLSGAIREAKVRTMRAL